MLVTLPSCLVKPEFRDGFLIPMCRCEAVTKLPGARQAEMLGRVSVSVPPLRTARLSLEPLTATLARAILAGDLSGLSAAPGWPHEHTAAGLAHAVHDGYAPGWLITTAGQVIGDGGTHGGPDERGCVEIGYGLAAPYRGQGLGSEAVMAMTAWLIAQPDTHGCVPTRRQATPATRRVLERPATGSPLTTRANVSTSTRRRPPSPDRPLTVGIPMPDRPTAHGSLCRTGQPLVAADRAGGPLRPGWSRFRIPWKPASRSDRMACAAFLLAWPTAWSVRWLRCCHRCLTYQRSIVSVWPFQDRVNCQQPGAGTSISEG